MKEVEIRRHLDEGWIRAKMIFEIAGKPQAHVEKTMKGIADKFEKENLKLIQMTIHRANEVGEGIYSSFTETDFLVSRISYLFGFLVDYMPSSIEIIEPDNLTETTANISDVLNDMMQKFHQYDNAFKSLYVKNVNLQNQLANSGKNKKKKK